MGGSLKNLIRFGIYTAGIYILVASFNCMEHYLNHKKALEESQKPHYGLELREKWKIFSQEELSKIKDLTAFCNPFSSFSSEPPLEHIVSEDFLLELYSADSKIEKPD